MHLKSLTLKGFKSFASPTTLKLEPGICAVVGPNGSGKSNVVDALAWVMGEQGAKTLRGGKMEDVIFAGAGDRKPLGRAEVTLTIDNSDGALGIDYTEVSVTRRMFRDGASEYEINGAKARLMDVQELLSDSGIGREMHVIVGQGRLAQILESRPEERRAFIEEAAGVLKHRRRKEKAQRKLVSMQANLDRLHDLTDELRRQLGPLSRQAEAASKASTVQATIRDAKVHLAAHRVRSLAARMSELDARCEDLGEEVATLGEQLDTRSTEIAAIEEQLRTALEDAEAAKSLWYRLSAIAERTGATLSIARDRAERSAPAHWTGQDPAELEARAERADAEQATLDEAVEMAREALDTVREDLAAAEDTAREAEREHLAAVRAIADRREGAVRLLAQRDSAEAAVDHAQAEARAAADAVEELSITLEQAVEDREEAAEERASLDTASPELSERAEQADHDAAQAEARIRELIAQQRELERSIAGHSARIAAWTDRLTPSDGAAVAVDAARSAALDLTPLSDVMDVAAPWGEAVAAALGPAAHTGLLAREAAGQEAMPASASPLGAIVDALQDAAQGRALLAGPAVAEGPSDGWRLETTPAAGEWLLDHITLAEGAADATPALTALLVDVVAVADDAQAQAVVAADPRLRAVTPEGVLRGHGWIAAGRGQRSPVELHADISAAQAAVAEAEEALADLQAALDAAQDTAQERRTAAAAARAAVAEARSHVQAAQNRYQAAAKNAEAVERQYARAMERHRVADERLDAARAQLDELSDRVSRLDADEAHAEEPSTVERDAATRALAAIRAAETEARLELRTAEERAGATRGKGDALRRQARQEAAARAQFDAAQARRAQQRRVATAVVGHAERLSTRVADALDQAEQRRSRTDAAHKHWVTEMARHRDSLNALRTQHSRMTEVAHKAEIERSQAQVQLEQALQQAMDSLALTLPDLEAIELPEDFNAEEARKELRKAEKALTALGKVNPLALEEFKALEERYTFLSQQLDDVEKARADLRDVIADVDETILQLFRDAWHDVEQEFPKVFATLFPGGAGRLVLTDPDDMLTTGIEVEARPPGKKVKRLTLLSGGEKSLTALAMLVAIFRARPSPFYVMDEVEAALDDVNLRRLIALFEELREDSQLIVITHQKPTMDVANVLYGVTMRNDGVTRVISQRMQPASAGSVG